MSAHTGPSARLYRALAGLLPPGARDDRDAMVRTYRALHADAHGPGRKAALAVRSLLALAWVLMVEWLEFLGVLRHRVEGRGQRRGGMGTRNLRYALRTLRRAPAFSLTSILLVSVGVGAVTTIFTLVDHVLLRPLPYPDADRLVSLDNGSFQGPFFRELSTIAGVEEWAGAWTDRVNLVGEGDPLRLEEARVSEDFFDLFGARAQRGRLLRPEDFESANTVVLDAGAWMRIFGGDPAVIGTVIRLDGEPVTVVGVMDAGFTPPEPIVGRRVDVWRPLDWTAGELTRHDTFVLEVAGRLASGTSIAAAQTAVDALVQRMAQVHDNYRKRDGTPRSVPVVDLADKTVRGVRVGLGLLMGAVGLLLLVACANVANLFLARGLGRTREMAVRRALGAGGGTLAAQLLVESLVVGLAGGLLGSVLAWGGIRAFVALNPTALPRQASVEIDPQVLGFAIAVSVLTSLTFGLLPALRSVRQELADELRGASRSTTTGRGVTILRNGLVAGEVALSLVLVAGAGLLLRSFLTVRAQDPGFAIDDVWTVPLNLPQPDSPEEFRMTMDAVLRQVREVPGVRSAAYGLTVPMDRVGGARCCWGRRVAVPGREDDPALDSFLHPVTPDYFTTLGVDVIAGRSWTPGEATADPVPIVVNQTLARDIAATTDAAVGMAVGLGRSGPDQVRAVVIGVAADARHYGLDQAIGNQLYLPVERIPFAIPIASVAARVEPAANPSMPRALRRAVWAAVPSLPVATVRSMREAVDASTAGRRFESVIFGAFAAVALLLAAGGLYGTLLYVAGQRRRELGIRLALGASRSSIEIQVLRTGFVLGAVGVALGLGGSWLSNRLLESRIWGVGRGDPLALVGAAVLLLLTAVVASWLPARRAGRVDPVETLRIE